MSILAAFLAFACSACALSDGVHAYVTEVLKVESYRRADADLNGDNRPETFVYVTDRQRCGSGGCNLFILSPHASGYRIVMRSTINRPPIWLLPTSTNGWRDVGVTVSSGGVADPYVARLKFDGQRYPSNPTVPPAIPLDQPSGTILIDD